MATILDLSGNTLKVEGLEVNGIDFVAAAPSTAIADITVTVTSGTEPTPNGAITIADATTPTVVELLEYCRELRAKVELLVDACAAHGITA